MCVCVYVGRWTRLSSSPTVYTRMCKRTVAEGAIGPPGAGAGWAPYMCPPDVSQHNSTGSAEGQERGGKDTRSPFKISVTAGTIGARLTSGTNVNDTSIFILSAPLLSRRPKSVFPTNGLHVICGVMHRGSAKRSDQVAIHHLGMGAAKCELHNRG